MGHTNYKKLKANLQLCISRLKILEKKKTELALKARKEIADYIAAGKEDRARIRVEHIIREDYLVEAMEMVEMFCDLLLARFAMIEKMKELDPGLEEAVCTVIWATPRMSVDVRELTEVMKQLGDKYGKEFCMACRENKQENVNAKVIQKMSILAPPKKLVENYMIEIAKIYGVQFEPDFGALHGSIPEADDLASLSNLDPPTNNHIGVLGVSGPGGFGGPGVGGPAGFGGPNVDGPGVDGTGFGGAGFYGPGVGGAGFGGPGVGGPSVGGPNIGGPGVGGAGFGGRGVGGPSVGGAGFGGPGVGGPSVCGPGVSGPGDKGGFGGAGSHRDSGGGGGGQAQQEVGSSPDEKHRMSKAAEAGMSQILPKYETSGPPPLPNHPPNFYSQPPAQDDALPSYDEAMAALPTPHTQPGELLDDFILPDVPHTARGSAQPGSLDDGFDDLEKRFAALKKK